MHAILSASGASRWMACPPSARLEEKVPNKTSKYAEEGTLAHEMGELLISYELGTMAKRTFNSRMKKLKTSDLYSPEMDDYVAVYIDTAMEKIAEAKERSDDALVLLEERLDFSTWVPEGFGTGDLVIISDGVLEIVDLKYGINTPVYAEDNKQMMLYALGALNAYDCLYDIETVKMTICQPRLDSITTSERTPDMLYRWATSYVKPAADLAYQGGGEAKTGNHCKFCRVKETCRAWAELAKETAKKDFMDPYLLSNEEIAEILPLVKGLTSWLKAVGDYALEEALNSNAKYEGFKVVAGSGKRQYIDETKVANKLIENGYKEEEIYKEREVLPITTLEKAIGKDVFDELLSDNIIKVEGKPKLVPISDKREEHNSAQADFN